MKPQIRIIAFLVILGSLLAIIIMLFSGDDEQKDNGPDAYKLRGAAQYHLERQLHNPDSYESIKWGKMYYDVKNQDTLYYIRHQYRATNKMGGLVRQNILFAGRYNDGKFKIVGTD